VQPFWKVSSNSYGKGRGVVGKRYSSYAKQGDQFKIQNLEKRTSTEKNVFTVSVFSGILETNFIKPTHDKQDFEKSVLYQRLEIRLKEMTYEYWYF
jgi:hypothetical protein